MLESTKFPPRHTVRYNSAFPLNLAFGTRYRAEKSNGGHTAVPGPARTAVRGKKDWSKTLERRFTEPSVAGLGEKGA